MTCVLHLTSLYLCLSDVHFVVGEVPEDLEGGTAGVPAVPRAGDQVPGRTELQGRYAHGYIYYRTGVIF
jgi:hypothetical protein